MPDKPVGERRKNPARKRNFNIAYYVVWNGERRTFDVLRGANPTGDFSEDKDTAIGLAIRLAQKDASEGLEVIVYTNFEGGPRVEWTS